MAKTSILFKSLVPFQSVFQRLIYKLVFALVIMIFNKSKNGNSYHKVQILKVLEYIHLFLFIVSAFIKYTHSKIIFHFL